MTTCYALADRHDPGTMRCIPCRLAWDRDDPDPPPCPAVTNGEPSPMSVLARPHDCGKSVFTRQFYSRQPPPMATA
jgi:hypothetical protein